MANQNEIIFWGLIVIINLLALSAILDRNAFSHCRETHSEAVCHHELQE